jgi:hypothetical protein
VTFDQSRPFDSATIRRALLDGEPAIDVAVNDERSVFLNPDTLEPGEEAVVLDRLIALYETSG